MIRNYDYGKLIQTNPIAYLGYLSGGTGKIHSYKTPLNALGVTFPAGAKLDPEAEDYDTVYNMIKEAGVDPKSIAGQILLGPEFSQGKNTYTLEHELMHRGLEYLRRMKPEEEIMGNDHLLIGAMQQIYGSDGHSHDLELESVNKETAKIFKDKVDAAQQAARYIIQKRLGQR